MNIITVPHVETRKGISKEFPKNHRITYPGTSDAVFYNLFSRRNIAAEIISIIEERRINPEDIEYKDKDFKNAVYQNSFMDIRFIIENKTDIDLEMQNEKQKYKNLTHEETLIHRLIKYSGNLITESGDKGENEYMSRGVHIVCFANFTYNNYEEAVQNYVLTNVKHQKTFPVFRITVILMPNAERASQNLRDWLLLLKSSEPLTFMGRCPAMDEAVDVLLSCDEDSGIREYYRQLKNAEEDERIRMNNAKAEAKAEGKAEGKAELIRAMHANGMTPDAISQATNIPLEEVKQMLGL